MKLEVVLYPSELLKESDPHFDMRLYITEDEMLSLVSSLTSASFEYQTRGIEYEVPRSTEVTYRKAARTGKRLKPVSGHGKLIFRLERPKR